MANNSKIPGYPKKKFGKDAYVLYPMQVKHLAPNQKKQLIIEPKPEEWVNVYVDHAGYSVSRTATLFPTEKLCQQAADIGNKYNGYKKNDALAIIAYSMENAMEAAKPKKRARERKPKQVPEIFLRAENILTVVDVREAEILPETAKLLRNKYTVYTDRNRSMREHLLNVPDAAMELNAVDFKPKSPAHRSVLRDLKELNLLCVANDAGYVRLIKY